VVIQPFLVDRGSRMLIGQRGCELGTMRMQPPDGIDDSKDLEEDDDQEASRDHNHRATLDSIGCWRS